jgi:DNA-binding NarL/FixJ family response regulator
MNMKKTVLLAEELPFLAEGMRFALSKKYKVIVEDNIDSIPLALKKNKVPVLLLCVLLTKGDYPVFVKDIQFQFPGLRVILICVDSQRANISKCLRSPASGVLKINAGPEELLLAIKTVLKGEKYVSPELTAVMKNKSPHDNKAKKKLIRDCIDSLTSREQQVLMLIAQGMTNREIADHLFVSLHTVKYYRKNLHLKLGVTNSASLLMHALSKESISSIQ